MTRLEPWFSSVGKDHSAIGWLKWMESSDGLVGHGLTKAIDVPPDFTNRKLSYFLSSSTVPRQIFSMNLHHESFCPNPEFLANLYYGMIVGITLFWTLVWLESHNLQS